MNKTVYFAHGMESGPWGSKITAMAKVAESLGFTVESPDYTFTKDPFERQLWLEKTLPRPEGLFVQVGSSLGSLVSALTSKHYKPNGLFLLAPAFGLYEKDPNPFPFADVVDIVHGWDDEVVPVENALQYAAQYRTSIHILQSDHRLASVLPEVCNLFHLHLESVIGYKKILEGEASVVNGAI